MPTRSPRSSRSGSPRERAGARSSSRRAPTPICSPPTRPCRPSPEQHSRSAPPSGHKASGWRGVTAGCSPTGTPPSPAPTAARRSTLPSWAWPPTPTDRATGWRGVTAGCSPTGTPPSPAPTAARRSTPPSWAWPPPRTDRATGWSRPTAGCSPTGTPPSPAPTAARRSTPPSWAWPPTRTDRATGWSRPTAGCCPTGTPPSPAPTVARRSTPPSWAWPPRRTDRAIGWSRPTAACSPTGTPRSSAPTAARRSTPPSWAWQPPRTAAATRWSRPTAGCSPTGTPPSSAPRRLAAQRSHRRRGRAELAGRMIGRSRMGRPSLRRLGSAALFVGAASAALALAGPDALVPFRDVAGAAAEVSVAFVVDFGGTGAPVVACVNVPSGDNGYQALAALAQQEDLAAPTYAASGLLCSINGIPTTGCGQQNPDGTYAYWSYWRLGAGGSWSYGTGRPPDPIPLTGDVEGWRFEAHGSANPNDPPPGAAPDYAAICPDALTSTPTTAAPVTPTTVAATQQPAVVASPGSQASPISGRPAAAVGRPE